MRAPFQVLVLPYRKVTSGFEVLICRRSDDGFWQAPSGGGEDQESPLDAAKRELFEETQLTGLNWKMLDAMCMLPRIYYKDHEHWDRHPYVIPEFAYSVLVKGCPVLSSEHTEFKWCSQSEAIEYLKYDSNKIAVWETFQRL
jgi:dATP pyrophosphohydrolase